MTKHRSAISLILSGAATITLDQRVRAPRILSTREALDADRRAIAGDVRRVMSKLHRERAEA